jgi:hypothetical protein
VSSVTRFSLSWLELVGFEPFFFSAKNDQGREQGSKVLLTGWFAERLGFVVEIFFGNVVFGDFAGADLGEI